MVRAPGYHIVWVIDRSGRTNRKCELLQAEIGR